MAVSKKTLSEWVEEMNQDPNPDYVKKNEDGSEFIPISTTQKLLDEKFHGLWDFEMLRETYGKTSARGYGRMICTCPINGEKITRGGDAAINLTGDLKMDSPKLEAMVLLSCAKKFARCLGRDLNRDKQDAPLPVIQIADQKSDEFDAKFNEVKNKMIAMSKGDAEMFLPACGFQFNYELKEIIKNKK